jgi:hypothetical protein
MHSGDLYALEIGAGIARQTGRERGERSERERGERRREI